MKRERRGYGKQWQVHEEGLTEVVKKGCDQWCVAREEGLHEEASLQAEQDRVLCLCRCHWSYHRLCRCHWSYHRFYHRLRCRVLRNRGQLLGECVDGGEKGQKKGRFLDEARPNGLHQRFESYSCFRCSVPHLLQVTAVQEGCDGLSTTT